MPTQTFNYTGGLQSFLVPAGITSVTVKAWGAQGGPPGYTYYQTVGGKGAFDQADFSVTPGEMLTILVGGRGSAYGNGGGGGGGSFVWRDDLALNPAANLLVAAGAGGGPGGCLPGTNGGDAVQLELAPGNGGPGGAAGSDGTYTYAGGGGGAGILTDGGTGQSGNAPFGPTAGGTGGTAIIAGAQGGIVGGGFGGGGGASWWAAGGGGGNSGGSGGSGRCGAGGGGTSFINAIGTNPIHQGAQREGNGLVQITFADLADLAVEKEASAETVGVGQPLTYTITVTNNGPQAATGVVLTDTVTGTATVTITANGCTVVANTVNCNIGNLAVGASVQRTIVVTPQTPGTIIDTAIVQGDQIDPNPDNNTAIVTSKAIPAADLAVTKTFLPVTVLAGQQLTYTITVTNNGPSDATGVVLTDTITGDVVINSISSGCTHVGNTVTCDIGDLPAGASEVFEIVVTPQSPCFVTNTASVRGNELDPNPSNNTTSITTRVFAAHYVCSELLINGSLVIPDEKPPVECILDANLEFEFTKAVIFDTNLLNPESLPYEVELKKVLILGIAKIIVKYAADVPDQQVHAAHFDVPFHALIEWLGGPPQGTPICVEPVLEKTRFCLRDGRTIEKIILVRLDVYPQ